MILKQPLNTPETRFGGETLLEYQLDEILYSLGEVEEGLKLEVKDFLERNAFMFDSYSIEESDDVTIKACCGRCLKAHALKKAAELGLDSEVIKLIGDLLGCETGHLGHYLDRGKLIRVD